MTSPEEGMERGARRTQSYVGILWQIGRLVATSPNCRPAISLPDQMPYGLTATSTAKVADDPLIELFMYTEAPPKHVLADYQRLGYPEYANVRLPGQTEEGVPTRRIYFLQRDGRVESIEEEYDPGVEEPDDRWVRATFVTDLGLEERHNLEQELQAVPRVE